MGVLPHTTHKKTSHSLGICRGGRTMQIQVQVVSGQNEADCVLGLLGWNLPGVPALQKSGCYEQGIVFQYHAAAWKPYLEEAPQIN